MRRAASAEGGQRPHQPCPAPVRACPAGMVRRWGMAGAQPPVHGRRNVGQGTVIRKATADRGITEEQLAQSLGVDTDLPEPPLWRPILARYLGIATKGPGRPRWHPLLEQQVREQMIFAGDHETLTTAKKASDGIEHGFLSMDEVTKHALKSADKTFH